MLTKLTVRNFKRFEQFTIDLAESVVFVGPNNSGKRSAMQALALWEIGVKRWTEKNSVKGRVPKKRPGVTINRRDLLSIPQPSANLLWRNRRTRDISKVEGRQKTENVRIEIIVEGVTRDEAWKSGFEFDYANPESIYCRPLRTEQNGIREPMPVPECASSINVSYLPPMSGLAATETQLELGTVNVRIGEGRTAEILRNLCWRVWETNDGQWDTLVDDISKLFGVTLQVPNYVPERGEITMNYKEGNCEFDLSSSGRGLQQTLLLLTYMRMNQNSVILLDEPDAHLEILRQRGIYRQISEIASNLGSQIIVASHSEVILNEAAGRDLVIAFVGDPHRIGNRSSQFHKSITEIGWDNYYQAEQRGWVLYLEGSTDLLILRAFAKRVGNERAIELLDMPYVHYVGNSRSAAAKHFFGLKEALPDLKGVALFDRIDSVGEENPHLNYLVWQKREIENYLCKPGALKAFIEASVKLEWREYSLFEGATVKKHLDAMEKSVSEIVNALETLGKEKAWSDNLKASDEFLTPFFRAFYEKLDLPNLMDKSNFHKLAEFVPNEELDPEIAEKLDQIVEVADSVSK